jgi:phage-related protein
MGLNVDPEPPILETLGDAVEYVNGARLLGEEISLSVNPNIASLEGLFQVPGGKPSNLRQAIFDESWGLASTYGVEVQISDGPITLVPPGFIGEERPLRVVYGLNLAEFSQNDATDGNHQFIFPYYSSNDLYLDLRDITSKNYNPPIVKGIMGDYAYVDEMDIGDLRIEFLDLTAVIDEAEIEAKRSTLLLAAQNYYRENKAKYQAIPVEIAVNISSIQPIIPGAVYDEQLNVGDTVTVIYPRWGVETKARCHRVEIDVLKEKAVKVQLGGTRRLVTDTIAKIYKRG